MHVSLRATEAKELKDRAKEMTRRHTAAVRTWGRDDKRTQALAMNKVIHWRKVEHFFGEA